MRRWMRLFQYTRLQDLLDYFLSHQGYMSPSVLTRHFQISQRTLRSDIHNLNEELSGFDAQIIMKRSQGYALEIKEGQTGFALCCSLVALLPALCVFGMGQQYLELGITAAAVKE